MLSNYGNNWMKKILRAAKIGCQRNFLNPIISKIGQHVVLLLINYIASQLLGIAQSITRCVPRENSLLF